MSINGVTYENVMMLDDLPCVFVPQSRMKTVITVQSGDSDQGGIVAGENAKDIACLITHCETPLAVSKLDAIKQFGPRRTSCLTALPFRPAISTICSCPASVWPLSALWWLLMSGTDKAAAIREKAERLAGRSLGENGDALTEMAMERACAWCGQEDIRRPWSRPWRRCSSTWRAGRPP